MKFSRIIYTVPVFFLLIVSSCTTYKIEGHNTRTISAFSGNTVLLLEPVFLNEILAVENADEIFEKNLTVGNIEYSGGVVTNRQKGMMVQTRDVSFSRQQSYKEKVIRSIAALLYSAAEEREYNYQVMGREELQDITKEIGPENYGNIAFTIDYLEHKEDGKDNINLPWYQFSIDSLSPETAALFNDATGARYLLTPVIEHYYSHSAGWFNDQWAGCGAGLRITYHVLVFDLSNGRTVFHFSDTERYLEGFSSRISEFLLMQEFTKIEKRIYKTILKELPRR